MISSSRAVEDSSSVPEHDGQTKYVNSLSFNLDQKLVPAFVTGMRGEHAETRLIFGGI